MLLMALEGPVVVTLKLGETRFTKMIFGPALLGLCHVEEDEV